MPSVPTSVPILFLSGLQDEIVPASHMRRLYDVCRSDTKVWVPLPNGTHNETVIEPGYFEAFEEFLEKHVAKVPPKPDPAWGSQTWEKL